MTNNTTTPEDAALAETQFMIQRIYIKNLSFEAPHSPQMFQEQWTPELTLDIQTHHVILEANLYEVVLRVTATVKNKNTTAFLVEIEQAGIFGIQGPQPEQLDHLLGSFCPSILFPYVREAITSEVVRGSFPQLILAPINFDALYAQKQQEAINASTAQQH